MSVYRFEKLSDEEFQAKWDAAMGEAAKIDQAATVTPEEDAGADRTYEAWNAWREHDSNFGPGGIYDNVPAGASERQKAELQALRAEKKLEAEALLTLTYGERPTFAPQDGADYVREAVDHRAAWLSAINGRPR